MVIGRTKNIKVCLLEKGDLISIKAPSVLLVDGMIVNGEAIAIDSIVFGNDDH